MDYVLPVGTKIVFRDTPHNLIAISEGALVDVTFGKIYFVEAIDGEGDCYFLDDADEANYAGFAINGEDGIFEIV